MNIATETIETKFQALLEEGQDILHESGWDGRQYYRHPSSIDYQRWCAEAGNLIFRVCGKKSVHYAAFERIMAQGGALKTYFLKDCIGVLQGAYNDFQDGFLIEIRNLIRAELLDDFLSQAEMLLEQGYYLAAASLGGAVLEDTLRKLCDKHSIAYPERTKIDTLNIELARAEIYDKLVQKEITAKADIRNNADHGHFDKFNSQDVEDMLRWVRRFVSEYLE